jgi:translation initiation factor IF-2
MVIKPIEKANRGLMIKVIFLCFLILISAVFGFFIKKKSKDIPSVLGEIERSKGETEKKLVDKVQKSDLVAESVKKAEEVGGQILGETTNLIQDIANKAASMASDLIYQNSIGKLVDQIDKLPQNQQERVKEQICH